METMERKALDIPALERLEPIHTKGLQRVFGALRLLVGWTFLWAFLDKAFALGFSTGRVLNEAGATVKIDFFGADAWIHGAIPTAGVLGFAPKGPFADLLPHDHQLPDDGSRPDVGRVGRLGLHAVDAARSEPR